MAQKHFDARIQWKRDTSSNWTASDPVLLNGEIIIVDTDSGEIRFKIGDGVKTYTQLPFEDEAIRNLINTKADKTITDQLIYGSVRHDIIQELTEEQKIQAKSNIGAEDEIYILQEGETLDDVPDYVDVVYDSNEESLGFDVGQFATKEDVNELSKAIDDLKQNGTGGSGLTTAQISALDGMFKVAAYSKADVQAEYNAFKVAFGITDSGQEPDEPDAPTKTITNISATYSGGDAPVGTALTDLIGITVTSYYSDGSTANVTDYTLSGEIAEGQNRITVSYNGFTTLIYVNGVADLPAYGVSNETKWTNGVVYDFVTIGNEYVEKNGTITQYTNWDRTPYLYCEGVDKLRFTLLMATSMFGSGGNGAYNAFYDADKNFICSFHMGMSSNHVEGDYVEVDVPENAVYFIASHKGMVYYDKVSITPYGEVA